MAGEPTNGITQDKINLQGNYVTYNINTELFITDAQRKIEPQNLTFDCFKQRFLAFSFFF